MSAAVLNPQLKAVSFQEAADRLMVSRPFLTSLIESGQLPFIESESGPRFREEDLLAFESALRQRQDKVLAEMDAEIVD